jgi:hypothetical protein
VALHLERAAVRKRRGGPRRPPGYPGWGIEEIKGHKVHFLLPTPLYQTSAFTGNTMFGSSQPQTACGVWGAYCFDTPARIKKGGYGNITFNDKKRDVVTETPSPSCTKQTADGTNTVSWSGKIKAYDGDPPPPRPASRRDPLALPWA